MCRKLDIAFILLLITMYIMYTLLREKMLVLVNTFTFRLKTLSKNNILILYINVIQHKALQLLQN